MADKAEVAFVATLAESLRANKIEVVQIAVINNVAMAEHRSESFKQAVFLKDMAVEALQRLEMVTVLGVVGMPRIPPAFAGAVFEPQRNNLPHD